MLLQMGLIATNLYLRTENKFFVVYLFLDLWSLIFLSTKINNFPLILMN